MILLCEFYAAAIKSSHEACRNGQQPARLCTTKE